MRGPFTSPVEILCRMVFVFSNKEATSNTVVKPHLENSCSICEVSWPLGKLSEWSKPSVKMWTWLFQKPAVTTHLPQLTTVTARANRRGFVVALGPTSIMTPLWTTIVPSEIGGSKGEG